MNAGALLAAVAAFGAVLAPPAADAATAYVSDELVLGVYTEQNQQGQRLTTLHSGASLETLATSGEYTQVRLSDGSSGWVKSSYLTTHEPATVRVKKLEEELDRSRATTPALAEAAARSELERLKSELAAKQSELDAALAGRAEPQNALPAAPGVRAGSSFGARSALAGGTLMIGALGGFWLGYATLARRVKRRFGGLRVY